MLAVGLMSGTSMDGIDAAILKTNGRGELCRVGGASLRYNDEFRYMLKAVEFSIKKHKGNMALAKVQFQTDLEDYFKNSLDLTASEIMYYKKHKLCSIDIIEQESTALHLQLVKELLDQSQIDIRDIQVIGYPGQTMYHNPAEGLSVTIGNAQLMSDFFQRKVISNFRDDDILNGGQGAPLAPIYHKAIATEFGKIPTTIVNCGGIANVTIIHSNDDINLVGYDTGPGNVLIDNFVRKKTKGKEQMDKDGCYGAAGNVIDNVLSKLYQSSIMKNNYFDLSYPKSLDVNDIKLIPEVMELDIYNGCRTLAAFTADSIVSSFADNMLTKNYILSGGGWFNKVILSEFKERLRLRAKNDINISVIDELGCQSQYIEAEIFAYLSVRTLESIPSSFHSTTGVKKPNICGRIYFPNS